MHLYQKHAPKSLSEFAGNSEVVEEVRKWALLIESGKRQKPLLLYGPSGVGKTALAYALASEMGWEILEFNASDTRNKDNVERIMGAATSSAGLFSHRKLILVDEVDGLEGAADRGGASAIASVIENATQPIILTANDAWDKKLYSLRSACKLIEMKHINKRTIRSVIARIAKEEGISMPEDVLDKIADSSGGDLRSAIIDLQAYLPGSMRDRDKLIFECVKSLFKAETYQDAMKSFDGTTVDYGLMKLWIESNIPIEYEKPEEIARAYNFLSRADVFDGRVLNRQAWKLQKYSYALILAGVALSKGHKYHKFSKYEFPQFLRLMSISSEKRALRKSIRRKVAAACHCSVRDADLYFPLIKLMAKEGKPLGFFGLDENELKMLGASANEESD
ncbi:MAG: replication factor C large subunit [Candidatus Micrarchaeota archaeon]|nr:replication factor C large subunit [Candidatus Micrarchaeota archaeon]